MEGEGFLSRVFRAFLQSDSIGLSAVVHASDQLVKQQSICERIIQCKNIQAALLLNEFLICLKLARLYLTELDTFLMCQSRMTPRYLNSLTKASSSPPRKTPESRETPEHVVLCLIQSVFALVCSLYVHGATRGDTTGACCSSCQPHPASNH